jgi:hypothetical protein
MRWIRSPHRRTADRLAVVDGYRFPTSVRQRFAMQRSGLATGDVDRVEDATRQWFRLAVRHPRARLSMPSVVVDDLWHELVLHTHDYAEFCEAAFGRFLHHVPESAMTPAAAAANRFADLAATFRLAQQDEGCRPDALPLLFRIDRELAVDGARRYLADCGGRGECHELRGTVCLQHITGVGRATRFHRADGSAPRDGCASAGIGPGCGAGCGGGT